MAGTMIPFDSFSILRLGVYDGAHGEPIIPPYEKGEPKKGWYILDVGAAQCAAFEPPEDEEDDDDKEVEADAIVDRAVFILWGVPKPTGPAAKAAEVAPVPAPEDKEAVVAEVEPKVAEPEPAPEPTETK
jgi:hypothetical protein